MDGGRVGCSTLPVSSRSILIKRHFSGVDALGRKGIFPSNYVSAHLHFHCARWLTRCRSNLFSGMDVILDAVPQFDQVWPYLCGGVRGRGDGSPIAERARLESIHSGLTSFEFVYPSRRAILSHDFVPPLAQTEPRVRGTNQETKHVYDPGIRVGACCAFKFPSKPRGYELRQAPYVYTVRPVYTHPSQIFGFFQ